ncbi:hypothetical protein K438DRAFT_1728158 [Mycena galopus ATCC 62051]|nr:hypothetical protein K438DRAFT_1728158 [Mycena galopus ATCC 62051]
MTKCHFLRLPPELILACLASLPFNDLDSCLKCGSRLLRDIIRESVFLRYRREQKRAGVEENPNLTSNLAVADRLAELRRRETNWLSFTPLSTHTIALDFETTGLYDLTSDMYFVGDTADPNTGLCTGIKYMRTSPGSEAPEWRAIDCGKPIIDFGTALEEHDLIAMVTYTLHDGNPQMASIDVSFFKLSTGASHPLATRPTLHVHDIEVFRGRPVVSIELVGQNMALSMVYWSHELRDKDAFHLYNWTSGTARMKPLPVYNTGLAFLKEDILILPNALDQCLDVFQVPEDGLTRFLHSFGLPELQKSIFIHSFQCRGSPNPRTGLLQPTGATFLPRPSDAVIVFLLQIGDAETATNHMFVVDRRRFAAVIALNRDDEDDNFDVDWQQWGPECTRWLDAEELSIQYITTTSGHRMVTIAHNAREHPAPIRMLNFSPTDVEAQRTRGPIDGLHATVRVVGPSTQHLTPFVEPLASELPYVEITSKQSFDYGAVLVNDQNIIGARFGDRSVMSLEVHHFG